MTALALAAWLLWLALVLASALRWTSPGRPAVIPKGLRSFGDESRPRLMVAWLVVLGLGAVVVGLLAAAAPPVTGYTRVGVVAVALSSALLTGGAVAKSVLVLADASSPSPQPRVVRTVLRGGAWIGALERVGVTGVIMAGYPEGMAVIVAVKGLARYPELRSSQTGGAGERFIIGTFASLSWAALCVGVTIAYL